ncbi:hypothetical protein K438DRAFT_1780008 [Mycena galopus ATCC 62051]|nr:hypothetical protein K438DRAFT_1780008 [Mycena galopus ATCC 62051]
MESTAEHDTHLIALAAALSPNHMPTSLPAALPASAIRCTPNCASSARGRRGWSERERAKESQRRTQPQTAASEGARCTRTLRGKSAQRWARTNTKSTVPPHTTNTPGSKEELDAPEHWEVCRTHKDSRCAAARAKADATSLPSSAAPRHRKSASARCGSPQTPSVKASSSLSSPTSARNLCQERGRGKPPCTDDKMVDAQVRPTLARTGTAWVVNAGGADKKDDGELLVWGTEN